jgi:hypothetical protein
VAVVGSETIIANRTPALATTVQFIAFVVAGILYFDPEGCFVV